MANGSGAKKPRIRKTAPTVRERVEQAQTEKTKQASRKPSAIKSQARKLGRPLKTLIFPLRFLKFLTPKYFINSWRELRLVVWPSRKETWRLTLAVFVFAIVFGALVAAVDKGLDEIFKHFVLK